MRVLHVAESFGGGVATAIESYVRNADMFEHVVAVHPRRDHDIGSDLGAHAALITMDGGKPRQALRIRSLIREVSPDVVHLHSSWAGFLGRLSANASATGVPLVYSPHCFAFERRDVSRVCAAVYRSVERALAPRLDAFAVVGRHEAALATSLVPSVPVMIVPHSVEAGSRPRRRPSPADRHLQVATLGRISPQKAPEYFLSVAASVREVLFDHEFVDFVWIGGGAMEDEWMLRNHGVKVTGWLPRDQALAALSTSDVYLHTAQWEAGVPLSLLEAAHQGLPVVAREIPALSDTGFFTRPAPAALARHIVELFDPATRVGMGEHAWTQSRPYCASRQRDALVSLYSRVTERSAA